MTLCPIALLVGCEKCLILKICPVKGIIGNYKKPVNNNNSEETNPSKEKE